MSKRQEIRARRRRQQLWNRILVIVLVSMGALLVVFALVVPSLSRNSNNPTSTDISFTPRPINAQMDGVHIGESNAPVKMDVWEDFQCSGCLPYTQTIEPQILQAYVETGKVYYTFRFYPFLDGGQGESQQSANAAMCANEQNRFWDYHDILFANWLGENVGSFTDARLVAFAQEIGLDMTAFNKCFQANTYADQIAQEVQAGTQLGVPPTPGIFVNNQIVISSAGQYYIPSFEDISRAIDSALQGQ